jgi:Iodothyronine deiodinase
LGALESMHARHRADVKFFVVYIKEAHPEDGWALTYNRRSHIAFVDPQSTAERATLAQTCARRMRTSLPMLVDTIDDPAARAYGGWPDRLYLVGRDGRIAFQGEQGPFGFRPELLEAAIVAELGGAAS